MSGSKPTDMVHDAISTFNHESEAAIISRLPRD